MESYLQAPTTGKIDAFDRTGIREPADLVSPFFIDQPARQTPPFLRLEDLLQNLLLPSSRRHKRDFVAVRQHRQRECNPPGGRLRRVLDGGNPCIVLSQQLVIGKQTTRMTIRPTAQQQQIKDGHLDTIFGGKAPHQGLLILVRQFLRIIQILHVDRMHRRLPHLARDVVEPLVLDESVVAVFVIEGHGALVGEEDLPFCELGRVIGRAIGGGEEGLCESLGEGATRDGDFEGVVAGKAGFLAVQNVGAEVGGKGRGGGIGEEIWWLRHCL